ncbi:uncharacterized protein LOC133796582 [Humulus lupulus]|uniref:uncharacterized protein LOC133796582 n=1 Tax=Humulus lupulus TaxID=3486 RepID=UPI002B40F98D|nr:uncharacterized protein LOC133796582 [Humulus lupulus]
MGSHIEIEKFDGKGDFNMWRKKMRAVLVHQKCAQALLGEKSLPDTLTTPHKTEGWFELASARHSMGASRVSSAMLDLNSHSAATSVQAASDDDDVRKAQFALCKWGSFNNVKLREDSLQLRHRRLSPLSE